MIGLVTFSIIAFAKLGLFVSPNAVKDEKIEVYRCEHFIDSGCGELQSKPRLEEIECVVGDDQIDLAYRRC